MSLTGLLQPGVPNPTTTPEDWPLFLIDLKDRFLQFFLHPDDCAHFAFSVPSVNNSKTTQQYRSVILPQGVMNSPTICQVVMDAALKEVWQSFKQIYLYHCKDNILLAAETQNVLLPAFAKLESSLKIYRLQIAPEKVQTEQPWKYLGWKLFTSQVFPQPLCVVYQATTLHDSQKLLGTINCV